LKPFKIVFIGSGNVATNLSQSLYNAGVDILQIYSRNIENARLLADKTKAEFTDNIKNLNPNADFYFFAVNDDIIQSLIDKISVNNKIVVHTSGSLSIDILNKASINNAVFYPLQSLTKGKIMSFKDIPVCLEGSNDYTLKKIKELASLISNNIYEINSYQRRILHVAAVFASNFTNFMYMAAEEILKKESLDFEILYPLIKETAFRIENNSPKNLMTGPAKRKDFNIIDQHYEFLEKYPDYKEVYKLITEKIIAKF
jgi:predicted short-subunit dehydrogenase-like oxidoreductase (DUF2520 family)